MRSSYSRGLAAAVFVFVLTFSPYAHAETAVLTVNDPFTDAIQLWSGVLTSVNSLAQELAAALTPHQSLTTSNPPKSHAPKNSPPSALMAAVALATEQPSSVTTISASSGGASISPQQPQSRSPPSGVSATIDPLPAPAANASAFVTQDQLVSGLSAVDSSLRRLIAANTFSAAAAPPLGGGSSNTIAAANAIDQLSDTTLNNVIVNGISGLTAPEIPDLSATYLPLTGGAITGNLAVSGSFTGGSISLSSASSTNASSTNLFASNATFANATSTNFFTTLANFTNAIATTLNASVANIVGLTATNSTTTNATTTTLAITGIASTSALVVSGSQTNNALSANALLYNNGSRQLAAASVGTSLTFSAGSLSLNLATANNWTALQTFTNASSTVFSTFSTAYFGGSATSSFNSAGALSLASALTVANGGTGGVSLTGLLQGNGTSAITGVTGTAGQLPYFNGTNTLLATSSLFLTPNGSVQIGATGLPTNWTGLGSVSANTFYSPNMADACNVKGFGAVGDGVTNDTTAIQNAVNFCFGTAGSPNGRNYSLNKELYFPPGDYKITAPIVFTEIAGTRVVGAGRFVTTIQNTTGSSTVFATDGAGYTYWSGFTLEGAAGSTLFDLNWDDGSSGDALQSNTFENIFFSGGAIGVDIGADGYMGSENLFLNDFWGNQTIAGLKTENYNALQNTIVGGNFQDDAIGIWMHEGTVSVYSTGFQENSSWDIEQDNSANDAIVISGSRSESPNFLDANNEMDIAITGVSQTSSTPGWFVDDGGGSVTINSSKSVDGQIGGNIGGTVSNSTFGRDDWLTGGREYITADHITLPSSYIVKQDFGHHGNLDTPDTDVISLSQSSTTPPSNFPDNSFSLYAPASIVTSYQWVVPAADAAGAVVSDGAGTPGHLSIVGFSGTGNIAKTANPTIASPIFTGNVGIGTTNPQSALEVEGAVAAQSFNATSTTATSTFANGINITGGCIFISGACLGTGGGGGSGTVNSGAAGQLPYYASNGTALTATSSIFLATSGSVGIGTTSPSFVGSGGLAISTNSNSGGGFPQLVLAATKNGGTNTAASMEFVPSNSARPSWELGAETVTGSAFQIFDTGSINGTAEVTITTNKVGVFDNSPTYREEIKGSNGNGYFGVTNVTAGDIFNINSSGNVGIGTSTPYSRLQVTGPDTASTSAFAVVNSASTTEFSVYDTGNAVLAGGLTQNSDQRLKTNIQSLEASSSLAAIDALNPVTFNWIDPNKGATPQLGFVAQQVLPIFPNLVSTTSATALTPDGTLSLNYIDLISPIVSAIQAISANITSIENTVAGFAQSFTTHLLTGDDVTANNKLCVGSTCVTPAQFEAMVAGANASQAGGSLASSSSIGDVASTTPDTPPVIQINGNNPGMIQVGASYNDLGATITGPQADLNLGITTYVNGIDMNPVQIDTSAAATDTIDYVATDQTGLTSTSTRTVIIEASPSIVPTNDASTTSATTTPQ